MTLEEWRVILSLVAYLVGGIVFTVLLRRFCKNIVIVAALSGVVPGIGLFLALRYYVQAIYPFVLGMPVLYWPVSFALSAATFGIIS